MSRPDDPLSAGEDRLDVSLNGETRRIQAGTTITALVATLRGIGDEPASGVAVALNEEVVPRSLWASTRLAAHDRVEVLVPTQGG
ncbi:MAG: sulfur carrier protein ThiS [Acidimicrobiales bacterium]